MKGFLKNCFYSVLDDKMQAASLLGFFSIAVFSFLNYSDEHSLEWLLRFAIYSAGVPLVFFFRHKGTWIAYFFVAYVLFHFSHYRNVSYFAIVCLLISFHEKLKYPLLLLYMANVFAICHFHDLSIKQVCFHAASCAFVYFSISELKRRIVGLTQKKLSLTEDEKVILDYLEKGIKQNDIPDFSSITVSRKLRAAKIRNGIGSTKELLEKYMEENTCEA